MDTNLLPALMSPFQINPQADQGCQKYDNPYEAPSKGVAVIPVTEECLWMGGLYSVETLAWPGLLTVL